MSRMLLSHNFNLFKNELPVLNKEEFARVFIDGLQSRDTISCSLINNPHWIVEILYSEAKFSAKEIGKICGQILLEKRRAQKSNDGVMFDILLLGGKKITPAISTSPTSLQPENWGVDVVETNSADDFLATIQWDTMIASKPADSVFKIEYLGKDN